MPSVKNASCQIREWAEGEFLPWTGKNFPFGLNAQIERLVSLDKSVCQFELADGIVYSVENGERSREGDGRPVTSKRGDLYRRYFQTVVTAFNIREEFTFAVELGDVSDFVADIPVFSFQKPSGSRNILIPDVDLIRDNCYHAEVYSDGVEFVEKDSTAVFVGATTGMLSLDGSGFGRKVIPITLKHVDEDSLPRLRAAKYFKDIPNVIFELPSIVQCLDDSVVGAITGIGVSGRRREWKEQFRSKVILSMDGNGATCSRVVIALKSNSLFAKYYSQHQLYYFKGLNPWINFVPINSDLDVSVYLKDIDERPEFYLNIVERASAFVKENITRIRTMSYTAEIMRRYSKFFVSNVQSPASSDDNDFQIDGFSHLRGKGDVWNAPGDWIGDLDGDGWMEGFALYPGIDIEYEDLTYRALYQNGDETQPVEAGQYCGSRGVGAPLVGIEVRLSNRTRCNLHLSCEAKFRDGTIVGPVSQGIMLRSASNSPISAFRLVTYRRPLDAKPCSNGWRHCDGSALG